MRYHSLLTLFVSIFQFQFSIANTETLKKGWDAFNHNQRKEAEEFFSAAAKDADTKAQASLALSLLYWSEDKSEASQKAFQDFFSVSENPYPYLYALWTSTPVFEGYGKKNEQQEIFLKKILDDKKANGTIKAMAHSMLGKNYEAKGDFQSREKEFSQMGSIENWQVLGTFDNTSANGFNKDFGALAKPKSDAVFKNKVNADIKWYAPPAFRSDRWFDFQYYFNIGSSIMYAQSFVKSDNGRDVFLRSGNSGSLKIWVNDKLVTSIADERNCDLDIYINNIKLNKGYNRILVQIGESETDNANFMIRITDKDGHPVKGISSEAEYHDYQPSADYTVNSFPLFAEEFFENEVKAQPQNLLNYLILADVYLRNDKAFEARKALKKARELAPESSFVGTRQIEAYLRDKDATDFTKEYENIKSKDSDCAYSLKGLMTEALDKEDLDEHERLINRYKSLYGESEFTDILELNLAGNRHRQEEVISLGKKFYEKHPDNFELMNLVYSIEKNTSKDLTKAGEILKKYLENNYSDKAMTMLAENCFDQGKVSEGFSIFQQRAENFPYSVGFYNDLSDLYFQTQDYTSSLKWAMKIMEFAPFVGGYHFKAAKILQAMKDDAGTKDELRKTIYYSPTNYDARKMLRKAEGQKDLFENFAKTDVYDLYKKSPLAEEFPEDNSIILLNETQRVVYNEGASEEHVEIAAKVFNQNGIESWKQYGIDFNPYRQKLIIEKAEVLKKDGSKVQAEKNKGTVVFTNLEVNDAVHLAYRVENYNSGKLAQHFWEQFNFNFYFPVLISRYSLIIPAAKKFGYQTLNAKVQPVVTELENFKMYHWVLKNQKSISVEPNMPSLSDVGAILDISTLPDWKFVSNWYSDLSNTLAKTDFEIKETVSELFKDKKNLTDLQKAKMIYEFIEANVSYSNVPFMHGPIIPQKASRTLSTKLGDCKDVSTLFVAMCKEAGLKANLILVDTRDNGDKHLNLPSIDFNHCIAQFLSGGRTYIIELTDQKLPFASLPITDFNANGLIIPREVDTASVQLIKLNSNTRTKNNVLRETELKIENNDIVFSRKNIKTGMFASQMRNQFADEGKDKQEKLITQAVAEDFSSPAKLLSLSFKNLDNMNDTVFYDYSFTVKNEVSEVAGIKIFRLPWSEAVRSVDFLTIEKRQHPFLVWTLNAVENAHEVMVIEISKGKTLAELPRNVILTCSAADYSLTYTITATGNLRAIREIKYKKDTVATEEYSEFREFFNKVAAADSKQIGFR